jgi:pyruvate kinase
MGISVSDLKIIASNGGGMIIDSAALSVSDLKIIVLNASKHKAQIIIKNPQKLAISDLKIIASNSKGCVVFDFWNAS